MAIRFYNGVTIASSTYYNTVSDDLWIWEAPSAPPSVTILSLDDSGLEWLSVTLGQSTDSAFHTSIPLSEVPEPTTVIAGLACAVALIFDAVRRRRKAS